MSEPAPISSAVSDQQAPAGFREDRDGCRVRRSRRPCPPWRVRRGRQRGRPHSQDEVSIRRTNHPSEIFTIGQQIEAEEIGRWRGQLNFSARACENPELRAFLVAIQPGQIVSGTVSGFTTSGSSFISTASPKGSALGSFAGPT